MIKKYDKYHFQNVWLKNYDISYFKIEGIYLNEIYFPKYCDNIVDKNSKTEIGISCSILLAKGTIIKSLKLIVSDLLENKYEIILSFELREINNGKAHNIINSNESTCLHLVRKQVGNYGKAKEYNYERRNAIKQKVL